MTCKEEKFRNITDELNETLESKNEDYGDSSFDLGLKGNFVHLWDKVKRLRQLVWEGKEAKVKDEKIRDTLMDIAGYGVLGVKILEKEGKK